MEQINITKKAIFYSTFLLLLITLIVFSCKKEDSSNNNNNNTNGSYQDIVDGRLVAINMDYLGLSLPIKTVGINTTNGIEQWTINDRFFTFLAPYNNSIYVSALGLNTPIHSVLYNFNPNTGTLGDSVNYSNKFFVSSNFENNSLFHLGGQFGAGLNLYKYNLTDTIPVWIKLISNGYAQNIIFVNSILYYTTGDSICAANGTNGNLIWATKLNLSLNSGGTIATSLMYNNNKLYLGANASTANFFCLNAQTGSINWSKKIISTNSYKPSYSIENNNLVVAEDGKNIFAVDKNTGANIWSFTAPKNINSSPTIRSNKVFFSANDSIFYCLNASNGTLDWKYNSNNGTNNGFFFNNFFPSTPIVADSAVIFTSAGKVHTLSINTGTLMWQYNFSGTSSNRSTALAAFILRDSIYYPGGIVVHK